MAASSESTVKTLFSTLPLWLPALKALWKHSSALCHYGCQLWKHYENTLQHSATMAASSESTVKTLFSTLPLWLPALKALWKHSSALCHYGCQLWKLCENTLQHSATMAASSESIMKTLFSTLPLWLPALKALWKHSSALCHYGCQLWKHYENILQHSATMAASSESTVKTLFSTLPLWLPALKALWKHSSALCHYGCQLWKHYENTLQHSATVAASSESTMKTLFSTLPLWLPALKALWKHSSALCHCGCQLWKHCENTLQHSATMAASSESAVKTLFSTLPLWLPALKALWKHTSALCHYGCQLWKHCENTLQHSATVAASSESTVKTLFNTLPLWLPALKAFWKHSSALCHYGCQLWKHYENILQHSATMAASSESTVKTLFSTLPLWLPALKALWKHSSALCHYGCQLWKHFESTLQHSATMAASSESAMKTLFNTLPLWLPALKVLWKHSSALCHYGCQLWKHFESTLQHSATMAASSESTVKTLFNTLPLYLGCLLDLKTLFSTLPLWLSALKALWKHSSALCHYGCQLWKHWENTLHHSATMAASSESTFKALFSTLSLRSPTLGH